MLESTLSNNFKVENENLNLAITILRAFIDCALEKVSPEIEITIEKQSPELELTMLMDVIKTMEWDKEFKEFFRKPAEEYFYIHYEEPQESEQRYQQFLDFAKEHGLCK